MMGNLASSTHQPAATAHESLRRSRTRRQSRGSITRRASISIRRMSGLDASHLDDSGHTTGLEAPLPAEELHPAVAAVFEVAPPRAVRMQRNLCDCARAVVRVDVVEIARASVLDAPPGAEDEDEDVALVVDRRVLLPQATREDVRAMQQAIVFHSYLAQQPPTHEPKGDEQDRLNKQEQGQEQGQELELEAGGAKERENKMERPLEGLEQQQQQQQQQQPQWRQHPQLVRLHGHYEHQGTQHLLTEFYARGSLQALLRPSPPQALTQALRDEAHCLRIVQQIYAAVAFTHTQGIAHHDLALNNLFLDRHGEIHLGDFQRAFFVGKTRRRPRVAVPTPSRRAYAAPELFTGREVDLLKADAWSLGIVLLALLARTLPFQEATSKDAQFRRLQVLGVRGLVANLRATTSQSLRGMEVTSVAENLLALLEGLLCCDPVLRCAVLDARIRFPWLEMTAQPEPKAQTIRRG